MRENLTWNNDVTLKDVLLFIRIYPIHYVTEERGGLGRPEMMRIPDNELRASSEP